MSRNALSRLSVMVVDDNQAMRALLRSMLEAIGTRCVHECADAASAVEMARTSLPDVILADLVTAPVDGLALTRSLRTDPDHPASSVPILMVTGFSDKEHVEAARDAGVTEFLAKPVTRDGLAARLMGMVENPRPFIRSNSFVGPDRRRRQEPIPPDHDRRQDGEYDDPPALPAEALSR